MYLRQPRTILTANPVQEEKTNMFNYASNGTQYDPNDDVDYATDPDPEYVNKWVIFHRR